MENEDKVNQQLEQTAEHFARINEEEKVQIYYDHYKDTYEQVKNLEKKRDWHLLILLILVSVVLLLIYDTEESFSAMQGAVESNLGIKDLSLGLVNMICECLLAYVSLAYYRTCLSIERLYIYIHNVEFNLSSMIGLNIDREGKNYLSSYPRLLNFAYYIYSYGIPVFVAITIVEKGIRAFDIYPSLYGIVELLLLLVTLISSFIYVIDRIALCLSSKSDAAETEETKE